MRSAALRTGFILCSSLLGVFQAEQAVHAQRSLEEGVRDAQAVFIGTLTQATPRWGNLSRTWIETEYEFTVDDAIVADERVRTGEKVTITRWGGQIGERRQMAAGDAALVKGQRYVLLLNQNYAQAENNQPLGSRDGVLLIAKQNGNEVVLDRRGDPIVVAQGRLARVSELAALRAAPQPISPAVFAKTLKADLTRIQSLPKTERAPPARAASPKSLLRPLAKVGARPDVTRLAKKLPQARAVKGIREPVSTAPRAAHLAGAKAVRQRAMSLDLDVQLHGEMAALPLTFNQVPADYWMAGVDVDCMVFWNHYFPGTFHIYEQPLDEVGYDNGVSDVYGFVTAAELQDITGAVFNGSPYFVSWWVNPNSNKIVEADIFFNADCDWTLNDTRVYNGDDQRVCFRRMMMQALGWSVGLDIAPGLAVMAVPEQPEFDGINQPQGDDIWQLDQLYPRPNGAKANLTITLASSPQADEWAEATFEKTAAAGGGITVGGYFLCNLGVGTAAAPQVDWYLCVAQNWDAAYYQIGSTTYPELGRGGWFTVDEGIERTLGIPADIPPGDYYLGAFIPGEENITVEGFFPVTSDSAFSRSKITITRN